MTDAAKEDLHPEAVSPYKGDTHMSELGAQVDSGGRQAIDHDRNHSRRRNRSNRHSKHHKNLQLKKCAPLNLHVVSGARMESNGFPNTSTTD